MKFVLIYKFLSMPIGHNFQENDRNTWQAEDSWATSKLGFATVQEKVE